MPGSALARRARGWALLWRPAAIFLASRVVTLLAAAVGADLSPTLSFGQALTRTWDAAWYVHLAAVGYPRSVPEEAGHAVQSTLGFFPLYPIAIRLVHHVGVSIDVAGLVVVAAAGLAAALGVWFLVAHRCDAATADRAVALFCFFPGAMVLSYTYSEALMLALAIGCLYALIRERWVTAGVLAALATATRPNAVALIAACGWAAAVAVWRRREWRALVAPALAPLGIVAFFAYLAVHTGAADAYLRTTRQGWGQPLKPASAFDTVSAFVHHPFLDTNIAVMTFGTAFFLISLAVLVRSRPPGVLIVYTLIVMGLALLTPTLGARPRFLFTAFPLVTTMAENRSPTAFTILLGTFAVLLGALAVLSTASLLATP